MAETYFAGDLSQLSATVNSFYRDSLNPQVRPEALGETAWSEIDQLAASVSGLAPSIPVFLAADDGYVETLESGAIAPDSTDPLIGQLVAPLPSDRLLQNETAPHLSASVTQAWQLAQTQLRQFAAAPLFARAIATAFGVAVDSQSARELIQDWEQGQGLPRLEIVPDSILQAKGAFAASNQTIYLGQDFVTQSSQSAIAAVLIEELGHALDSRLNTTDAAGDEGAIFAALVQGKAIAPSTLAALQTENDHAYLHWQNQTWAVEQAALGEFTVGASGQVSIEFLFDGGAYTGELAIFSLAGMETLTPGSAAYIQEAARRALSQSPAGYVVISEAEAGVSSLKQVAMNAGDSFGVMLVPDDTVKAAYDRPDRGGKHRPLFSIEAANPKGFAQMGQLASNLFAMEDLRRDRRSDNDFNDIIFKIAGATGEAVSVGALLPRSQNWQNQAPFRAILAANPTTSLPTAPSGSDPSAPEGAPEGNSGIPPNPNPNPGSNPGSDPGSLPTTLLTSFSDSVVKFSPADSEATIAALSGSKIVLGDQTIYIGTQQVSANNQNPIISLFDSSNPLNNWTRTDYEITGADGRGIGLAWTGSELYGVFTVDGTQGSPSEDFRRESQDAQQTWLRSYGQGGGPTVSVIGRIDLATGELVDAAYLSALLSNGNSNTLVVNDIAVNNAGNLVVSADSYFSPRRPNGSAMQQVGSGSSPFAYTVEILPNLKQVVSTQANGWV
ncbi:DUF4114 domain-containing protein [Almyronema epifaneia]|uniref:DUF4114 domain-containing protein n=1 Tax=Almyronema epifaneia S1 TaxID=2991925 RepID=A0ABW6IG79_9CYAN